jgi:phage baseplate assembly protein W
MPGERIMVPEFGVGIYGFLFDGINDDTFSLISQTIKEQVDFYMPSVNLEEINFLTSDEDSTLQINEVRISVKYNILPFNQSDELIITSTMTN